MSQDYRSRLCTVCKLHVHQLTYLIGDCMKKCFFIFCSLFSSCIMASSYHEIKPLPSECYASAGYTPDPVQTTPQCFALADFQAKRHMKTQDQFFHDDYPDCLTASNSNANDLNSALCSAAYINYEGGFVSAQSMSQVQQALQQ